jgi:hypothetical protein
VVPPKPEPLDLQCDLGESPCSGDCPTLPAWTAEADGGGDFDALLTLGPQDRLTLEACQAKLRACQACLDRGRAAGVIR